MRTKVQSHPYVKQVFSKHFLNSVVGREAVPVEVTMQAFVEYWQACPQALKQTSLCFFQKELIEVVNKTNTRLLYAQYVDKLERSSDSKQVDEDDYKLLNAFEMLWNIDPQGVKTGSTSPGAQASNDDVLATVEQSSEEMDLVKIMSHTPTEQIDQKISKVAKQPQQKNQVLAQVLTLKEEYLDSLLQICTSIRPESFLNNEAMAPISVNGKKVLVQDESLLIKAIDASKIATWSQFEFILSIVIENRLLRLFQAHLDTQYQLKWNESTADLIQSDDQQKRNNKRRRKKKSNKTQKMSKLRESSAVVIQRWFRIHIKCLLAKQKQATPDAEKPTSNSSPLKACSQRLATFTKSNLLQLPMASVVEKLNFPLKFDKDAFVLDFNSGKSTASDEKASSNKRSATSSKSGFSLTSFRGSRSQQQSFSTGMASTYKFNLDSEEFKVTRRNDGGKSENNSKASECRLSKFYLYSPAVTCNESCTCGSELIYDQRPLARICEDQEQSEETSSVSSESSVNDGIAPFSFKKEAVYFNFEDFLEENYSRVYSYFEQAAKARRHVVNAYNFNPKNKWHNMYLQNQQLTEMQNRFEEVINYTQRNNWNVARHNPQTHSNFWHPNRRHF